MWINEGLRSVLMILWISHEFSFDFVDLIHILMNTQKPCFTKASGAFTQTHSPYY